MTLCPCQSGKEYNTCCGLYHLSESTAPTPEALMRSRYCAYVRKDIDYIYNTYAANTRIKQSKEDIKSWADSVCFIKLEIVEAPAVTASSTVEITPATQQQNQFGYVEFIASYLQGNQLHKLQEKSRFIHTSKQWFYLDGQLTTHSPDTIGRNQNCPCGSGKKFKRCHG